MSDGNNKAFMNNPVEFLKTQVIIPANMQQGPDEFDLCKCDEGVMRLEKYYNKRHGLTAQPIRAFYLPSVGNQKVIVELKNIPNGYNYIFTPLLSGCLFAVYGQTEEIITIEHMNDYANKGAEIPRRVQEIICNFQYYKMISPVNAANPSINNPNVHTYVRELVDAKDQDYDNKRHEVACVIGVRNNKTWSFYYKKDGANVVYTLK